MSGLANYDREWLGFWVSACSCYACVNYAWIKYVCVSVSKCVQVIYIHRHEEHLHAIDLNRTEAIFPKRDLFTVDT